MLVSHHTLGHQVSDPEEEAEAFLIGLESHDLANLVEDISDIEHGREYLEPVVLYPCDVQSIIDHVLQMHCAIHDHLEQLEHSLNVGLPSEFLDDKLDDG